MRNILQLTQKVSAAIMIPLIVGHIGLAVYVSHAGLSATEILNRTQGHTGWVTYYTLLVVAVAVHGPIGVRNIFCTWTRWRGLSLDAFTLLLAGSILLLGLQAVGAMTAV